MELLPETMRAKHLLFTHSALINDTFSATWGREGGGQEGEEAGTTGRRDQTTVHR